MLFDLIRKCSVLYLGHTNPLIRREAALSLSKLLAKDDIILQSSDHALRITNDILVCFSRFEFICRIGALTGRWCYGSKL